MKEYISPKFVIFLVLFFALINVSSTQAETLKNACVLQTTCGDVEVLPTPSVGTYDDDIDVYINISNNSCEMSAFGFDLFYDTSMFSYQAVSIQNCLTADWSMMDAYEITPGQVRIGGYAGSGSYIQSTDNGSLVIVTLRVICQCGTCYDGQQSTITIDDYNDDLASYLPQPAQGIFTMICCSGDIALPANEAGTWGDIVHIPVSIANNSNQISDFMFDFVFDSTVLEFQDALKTNATQDWSTLDWSLVSAGQVRITGVASSGTPIPTSSSVNIVSMKLMVKCVTYSQDTSIPIQIERYMDGIADMCPRTYETTFLYRKCPRLGDVNDTNSVTPGDAQASFEIYLGRIVPTTAQLTVADANCSCPCAEKEHTAANNCITPGDAQMIFEHYLGIQVLPTCCADFTCGGVTSLNGGGSILSDIEVIEENGPSVEKRVLYPLPTIARSTERVMIPVMIDNPRGVRQFALEMYYPQDLLECVGTLGAPLTQGLIQVRGEVETPGIVRIEGVGDTGITTNETGSLVVVVFQVRGEASGSAHISLGNFMGDILEAETGSSTFVCGADTGKERGLTLGHGRKSRGLLVVPVEVTDAFDMKAFGLEVKYEADRMTFLGVEPTELTRDFVAVDGNEVADGVVRIGGYGMSGIQEMASGALVELVFQTSESGGNIEIIRVLDDLKDFLIIK